MKDMYDDNRNKSNMESEDGHPADESEKREKAITVNNEAVNSSGTVDEMDPLAIETELRIERAATNSRSIVGDIYRDCRTEHSDIKDPEKRDRQARFETLCTVIMLSGGFLEDILLKRLPNEAPDKQARKEPRRKEPVSNREWPGLEGLDGTEDPDGPDPM